jgi:hypothetical protein
MFCYGHAVEALMIVSEMYCIAAEFMLHARDPWVSFSTTKVRCIKRIDLPKHDVHTLREKCLFAPS